MNGRVAGDGRGEGDGDELRDGGRGRRRGVDETGEVEGRQVVDDVDVAAGGLEDAQQASGVDERLGGEVSMVDCPALRADGQATCRAPPADVDAPYSSGGEVRPRRVHHHALA